MAEKRNRRLAVGSAIYLLCVIVSYAFGMMTRDEHGVSFLPTILLTLPWFYVFGFIAEKVDLVLLISALYGFPLFLCSAAMNISIAAAFRAWQRRSQVPDVSIAPR